MLLIVRVLSFEWRERSESPRWRMIWTWANTIGSVGAPLIWGIALASLLYGTPIDAEGNFTGSFVDLFSWYSVLAGVALVFLFAFHGAVFLTLRTVGDLCDRAQAVARRLGPLAVVTGAGFLVATLWVGIDRNERSLFPGILLVVLAAVAVIAAVVLTRVGRLGAAFAATATTIVLAVVTLFTMLYPRVMVSSSSFADSLTIDNAASGHYTLTVMTVAVADPLARCRALPGLGVSRLPGAGRERRPGAEPGRAARAEACRPRRRRVSVEGVSACQDVPAPG